jgi:hypothetical protein
VLERFLERVAAGARFRVPGRRNVVDALVSALKWAFIYGAFEATLALGRSVQFGDGLMGAIVVPLLVFEARLAAGSRWRMRFFQMLAFALPMFTYLSFWSVVPTSHDYGPWTKMLRNLEWVRDFFFLNALATLPAYVALILLRRGSAPPAEKRAYFVATFTGVLAALSVTVTFAFAFHALKSLLGDMP